MRDGLDTFPRSELVIEKHPSKVLLIVQVFLLLCQVPWRLRH